MKTSMNFLFPQNDENFLSSWETVIFSSKTELGPAVAQAVSYRLPGFEPWSSHVEFMVDNEARG
jgi:hypothetical protein